MSELETFRQDVRRWLDANCPPRMRTPMPQDEMPGGGRRAQYKHPETKVWLDAMAEKGWTVPTWPVKYGGAGLDKDRNQVLQEELRRINARPPLFGMGISMIGPALLEFGTDEQKAEHLPKIARGQIWWCQGYSEPNAGSDLASLKTSAVENGDEYIINGSKIWTSGADHADWIFCLVRTDPKAPKHDGITFILFDIDQPGVTVKPILLISGMSPFCETFFDNARALKKNVVGEVNKGWTVAKRLLQYERTSIGGIGGGTQQATKLEDIAKDYLGVDDGRIADDATRQRVIAHRMNDRSFAIDDAPLDGRVAVGPRAGRRVVDVQVLRHRTEHPQLRTAAVDHGHAGGRLGRRLRSRPDELTTTRAWLRSKANSIEGGTSEVQLNILAKRVLGLPD